MVGGWFLDFPLQERCGREAMMGGGEEACWPILSVVEVCVLVICGTKMKVSLISLWETPSRLNETVYVAELLVSFRVNWCPEPTK